MADNIKRMVKRTLLIGYYLILFLLTCFVLLQITATRMTRNEGDPKSDFLVIENAIRHYMVIHGKLPPSLDHLVDDKGVSGWMGPYLSTESLMNALDSIEYNIETSNIVVLGITVHTKTDRIYKIYYHWPLEGKTD